MSWGIKRASTTWTTSIPQSSKSMSSKSPTEQGYVRSNRASRCDGKRVEISAAWPLHQDGFSSFSSSISSWSHCQEYDSMTGDRSRKDVMYYGWCFRADGHNPHRVALTTSGISTRWPCSFSGKGYYLYQLRNGREISSNLEWCNTDQISHSVLTIL